MGIRKELANRLKEMKSDSCGQAMERKMEYVTRLKQRPIAIGFLFQGQLMTETDKANEQHYEVSAGFFEKCLGPRLKYSCCLYPTGSESLEEAEIAMLESYVSKAGLVNGMDMLDLGCGWGSLSLFLAEVPFSKSFFNEKFPGSKITSLSNSHSQKQFIDNRAKGKGLANLTVVTGDVKDYDFPANRYLHSERDSFSLDRILSIEMFEHMKNYDFLLKKVSSWLRPEGKLFVHIFCHKSDPYDMESGNLT